jgi:hypothetical protein
VGVCAHDQEPIFIKERDSLFFCKMRQQETRIRNIMRE